MESEGGMTVKYLGVVAAIALVCLMSCSQETPVAGQPEAGSETESGELVWLSSIEEGIEKAGAEGRKIVVLFTNPQRCPPCRMLDEQTIVDDGVKKFLQSLVLVKMDAWDEGKGTAEAQRFNVRGIPTTVVLDSGGEELGRAVGYMPPNVFIDKLSSFR